MFYLGYTIFYYQYINILQEGYLLKYKKTTLLYMWWFFFIILVLYPNYLILFFSFPKEKYPVDRIIFGNQHLRVLYLDFIYKERS